MKHVSLALPVFGFVVATRAALGAGIGLLVADRLPERRRRIVGAALVAVGVSTTLPAAIAVVRGVKRARRTPHEADVRHTIPPAVVERDERLIGVTRYARKGDDAF
jgi:hypothetical protein